MKSIGRVANGSRIHHSGTAFGLTSGWQSKLVSRSYVLTAIAVTVCGAISVWVFFDSAKFEISRIAAQTATSEKNWNQACQLWADTYQLASKFEPDDIRRVIVLNQYSRALKNAGRLGKQREVLFIASSYERRRMSQFDGTSDRAWLTEGLRTYSSLAYNYLKDGDPILASLAYKRAVWFTRLLDDKQLQMTELKRISQLSTQLSKQKVEFREKARNFVDSKCVNKGDLGRLEIEGKNLLREAGSKFGTTSGEYRLVFRALMRLYIKASVYSRPIPLLNSDIAALADADKDFVNAKYPTAKLLLRASLLNEDLHWLQACLYNTKAIPECIAVVNRRLSFIDRISDHDQIADAHIFLAAIYCNDLHDPVRALPLQEKAVALLDEGSKRLQVQRLPGKQLGFLDAFLETNSSFLDDKRFEALQTLSSLYMDNHLDDKAYQTLKKAVVGNDKHPVKPQTIQWLASTAVKGAANRERAIETLDVAARLVDSVDDSAEWKEPMAIIGIVYVRNFSEYKKALPLLERAYNIDTAHTKPDALNCFVRCLYRSGRESHRRLAVKLTKELCVKYPLNSANARDVDSYYEIYLDLSDAGDKLAAYDYLKRVIELIEPARKNEYACWHFEFARSACPAVKKFDEGRKCLEQLSRFYEGNDRIRNLQSLAHYADFEMEQKNKEKGLSILTKAIELAPSVVQSKDALPLVVYLFQRKSDVLFEEGKFDESADQIKSLRTLLSKNKVLDPLIEADLLWREFAICYSQLGRTPDKKMLEYMRILASRSVLLKEKYLKTATKDETLCHDMLCLANVYRWTDESEKCRSIIERVLDTADHHPNQCADQAIGAYCIGVALSDKPTEMNSQQNYWSKLNQLFSKHYLQLKKQKKVDVLRNVADAARRIKTEDDLASRIYEDALLIGKSLGENGDLALTMNHYSEFLSSKGETEKARSLHAQAVVLKNRFHVNDFRFYFE